MNTRNRSIPPATTPAVVDKEKLSELPTSEGGTEITGDGSGETLPPVDPITPAAGTEIEPLVTDTLGAAQGDDPTVEKDYTSVVGFMIDPNTQKVFDGGTTTSVMTGWLGLQIDAGKIKEVSKE